MNSPEGLGLEMLAGHCVVAKQPPLRLMWLMKKLALAALTIAVATGRLLLFSPWHAHLLALFLLASILSVILAGLLRNGETVLFVMGIVFLTQGGFAVVGEILEVWADRSYLYGSLYEVLRRLSFLGLPTASLYLSIYVLWSRGKKACRILELIEAAICMALSVASVVLYDLSAGKSSPWDDVLLFMGAGWGIGFAAFNFTRAMKPVHGSRLGRRI